MANSPIQGIDNIGICVTDLARSIQFYRHLGFDVLFQSDRGVTLALGPAKLFLFPVQPGDERIIGRQLGLSGNPPGIDHISFLVDDVDALHASLTARGMDAGPQPADQDWGARAFGLIDPDGNNLYFLRWLLPGATRADQNQGAKAPPGLSLAHQYDHCSHLPGGSGSMGGSGALSCTFSSRKPGSSLAFRSRPHHHTLSYHEAPQPPAATRQRAGAPAHC